MTDAGQTANAAQAPELKPTVEVYLALVSVTAADFQTAEGVERFLRDARVLLPHLSRQQLLAMDFGELTLMVRERIAEVSPLFRRRADDVSAVAQAEDLLND